MAIREARFQRWLHTASGEAGGRMRSIIDDFVDRIVVHTHPFTEAELAAISARVPDDRDPPPWASR